MTNAQSQPCALLPRATTDHEPPDQPARLAADAEGGERLRGNEGAKHAQDDRGQRERQ
jgi:hypothetical protein